MRKLAIFVEGLTEQILVRQMLQAVLDRNRIAIQTVKITGGHNVKMSFTVMRAAHVERQTDFYVLIYDCGGETNVKGYLMARRQKLIANGYTTILGLRDVYPNFEREDVPKLLRGLNHKLPQKHARTRIYLAIMETEAWFLGEYHHLKKVSRKLTPEFVEKHLGFNPKTENMEEREHPSVDMKAAYQLVNHDYTKKRDRLNAVISKLDFNYFTHDLAKKMPSLGKLIVGLEQFFKGEPVISTAMSVTSVVGEVVSAFSVLSDPARIEKSKTYFPTSMKVMGVTNPEIKAVIKELKSKYAEWDVRDWIMLGKGLVAKEIFECQVLAFELIGRDKIMLSALRYDDLPDLGKNLDNWASVDHYTVGIFGVLWGKGVVTDQDIDRLLQSDNYWERRVAVVSTVALNLKSRGGTGDTPRTILVCERVVDDHQDMIQKALSWALRELSKRDRNAVVDFMEIYESRLARRVIKEVNHKLDFGTKN